MIGSLANYLVDMDMLAPSNQELDIGPIQHEDTTELPVLACAIDALAVLTQPGIRLVIDYVAFP